MATSTIKSTKYGAAIAVNSATASISNSAGTLTASPTSGYSFKYWINFVPTGWATYIIPTTNIWNSTMSIIVGNSRCTGVTGFFWKKEIKKFEADTFKDVIQCI